MVKAALGLGLVVTLLASGCAGTGSAGARMLSTDRTAPLAYVALGDSTVSAMRGEPS